MADDPNPTLRAELLAALSVLGPQIRGLDDLSAVSISPELRDAVSKQSGSRKHRRDLIQAVVDSLDHVVSALRLLEQDGYPELPGITLVQSQFGELQEEAGDLRAAVAIFKADVAANLAINFGTPADKPSAA